MLWDTSCPRDWESRWVPTGLGHDAEQLRSLRRAPDGFYT